MEMACEEARQAGRVVWWRCAGTSGESVDQEAEQSGAGGSAHEGNKIWVWDIAQTGKNTGAQEKSQH